MKIVFLVGPTASGKSALALDLAEKFGGAIVNSDSVQMYEGLQIGSAAPTAEEKARVPHFLFQEVGPPKHLTAGDFEERALETFSRIKDRFPVVFVVGGTGFYLMALEKGMLPIRKSDPELQAELERQLREPGGEEKLHRELREKDPVVARRISPNDHYRLARAIEVIRDLGRPLSEVEEEHRKSAPKFPYPLLKLGVAIDREILRERVKRRTRLMLETGLLGEVEALLQKGFADWEPLQSVGYKESLAYLARDPELPDRAALEEKIVQNTMRLAKKQRTWFQRDPEIQWGAPEDRAFFGKRVAEFLMMQEKPR